MGPLSALFSYWRGLAICAAGGKYSRLCSALPHLTPQERLCIYSLALHLRLFGDGHYRSGTFQNDLAKNLRNVALPSTGVPLSVFCSCRPLALLFAWFLLPLAALVAAVRRPSSGGGSLGGAFASSLLSDWSWFHYWRLNCVLASYHALATSDPGYGLEDSLLSLARACGALPGTFPEPCRSRPRRTSRCFSRRASGRASPPRPPSRTGRLSSSTATRRAASDSIPSATRRTEATGSCSPPSRTPPRSPSCCRPSRPSRPSASSPPPGRACTSGLPRPPPSTRAASRCCPPASARGEQAPRPTTHASCSTLTSRRATSGAARLARTGTSSAWLALAAARSSQRVTLSRCTRTAVRRCAAR
mmetsp:Transcript_51353/g.171391  ORF Transcript_51353/g.171391 Transcript_51353/m.171391 type:complete len:360 (-) Transcript_51353:763-1842(-)